MAKKRKPTTKQPEQSGESDVGDGFRWAKLTQDAQAPETKNEKFKRIAEVRVENATRSIRRVGRLANKYYYDYADTDAQKILRHLQSELDEVRRKFTSSQKRNQTFSLD